MVKDITLGQYYPSNSAIHRLDARTKLFGTALFVISLFSCSLIFYENIYVYGLITVALFGVILLSKIPLKYIFKAVKPIIIILTVSAFINLFFTKGETVLFQWTVFTVSKEGIRTAVYVTVRLIYLIVGSSLMSYTTTPTELTDGLEKSFQVLNLIKIPVHEIAMMMSIALRFIPILMEELDKIMKAQLARGADFESGNLLKRLKNMIPILVPLLFSAIRRANDLAIAMDARCYNGGKGRTKLRPLKYQGCDLLAYGCMLGYLAIIIGTGVLTTW